MTDNQDRINQLLDKLEILLKKQNDFSREINNLKIEVNRLKVFDIKPIREENKEREEPEEKAQREEREEREEPEEKAQREEREEKEENRPVNDKDFEIKKDKTTTGYLTEQKPITIEPPEFYAPKVAKPPKEKSNLEKFIGENLINKIGIIITVIGVAIGTKYAIDHQLIGPLTRIILGYLFGLGLLGFAIRLKKEYENFSAVLLSGSMAIMYLITYSAFTFYDLFPQVLAFILMLIFTAFTVVAAIKYNRQVIAHIGLVGAYAVPFLLSEVSENIAILFSYMAIINIGILVLSFNKYWKPLYYSSFGVTWVIYLTYLNIEDTGLALTFLSIFFATFYLTFLTYKLVRNEKFKIDDIILLLANSFIFYGIGYVILYNHETGEHLLGLFTLFNAIVHFIVCLVIHRQKFADKNLFHLITGLVLVFITITIPVQLEGYWVTLLWAGEAALLFWIGRTKNAPIYEMLSYPLMILAFFNIIDDWSIAYGRYSPEAPETRITPLLNINFLNSLLVIAAFGFMNFLNRNKNYVSTLASNKSFFRIISYSIPIILLITLYYAFRLEISNYWYQLYADSALEIVINGQEELYMNEDLKRFNSIWIINYSLLFFSILSFVNFKKLRDEKLGLIILGLKTLTIIVFLTQGLNVLGGLRESYLEQTLAEYYPRDAFNIGIRYISFAFIATTLVTSYKQIRRGFTNNYLKVAFDFLLYLSVLWIISSEIINWLDIAGITQFQKLGLSIFWGVYSLLLIALGIWKQKMHLRVAAIVLFGVTLFKLLVFDLSHLDTIPKTIVFVSLGILLLIISFLYNKYRHIITDETPN